MTTTDRWAELRRLCEGASPGPWEAIRPRVNFRIMSGERFVMEAGPYGVRAEEDAQFIAAARSAVPDLLAENARLRQALEDVRWALTVPAAEYVPAIPDTWAIVDAALAAG